MAKKKPKMKPRPAAKAKSKAKPRPVLKSRPKAKAAAKKPAARPAAKPAAKPSAKTVSNKPRMSWLDDAGQAPMIERYAKQLGSFLEAVADGRVEEAEVKAQENRLVRLMKEVEPQLDAGLHEKVTRLLCELTAYDLMQMLHSMQENRPKTVFQG